MVPEVLGNRVEGNEARDGDGGGIYYRSLDDGAVIRGNTVVSNRAGDHGGGIYAALVNAPPPALQVEISWNLIANNVAHGSDVTGESGGGITLIETDAWVHHNTIVANEGGATPTTLGGGIAIERIGSPLIEQNVVAFTVQGGGIFCLKGATPLIRNNFAWQNGGGEGLGECPTWWQSNGNVIDNPYFCDMANGDYRVASNSGVMTHPAGPLGAFPDPGCGPVAVHPSTWGAIKARYSSRH
jgi:parallel beta-helix repeat protein